LLFACLGLLALFLVYQLQIRQDADAQTLIFENAREGTRENAQEGTRQNASEDTSSSGGESSVFVRLDVPLIMQLPELPTGCEATATAMMLQYAGSPLTKFDVALEMPYSDDPNQGFVGDPFTKSGFTIYPQALMSLVYAQLGSAVDLSGATFADLRSSLLASKPICCWIADDRGYVHCVIIIGYENDIVYLNDPLEGSKTMTVSEFDHLWANNARRALSY
jgi:uncharacterized protein YvpB